MLRKVVVLSSRARIGSRVLEPLKYGLLTNENIKRLKRNLKLRKRSSNRL